MDRVKEKLERSGNKVKVRGLKTGVDPNIPPDYCFHETARKHQINSYKACLGHKCATIEVATGGGKTLIMAMIASWLVRTKGWRVLVTVPGKDLLNDTFEKFKYYIGDDITIGRIGDGRREIDKQITIGIVNSLVNGVPEETELLGEVTHKVKNHQIHEFLQEQRAVLMDECQSAGADTWFWVAVECKAILYYAFSGTVETGDSKKDSRREAVFGPVRYRVPAKALIKKGVLSTPTIYMLMDDGIYCEIPSEKEYAEAYQLGIVSDLKYNTFISRLVKTLVKSKRQVIINVRRRSQGLLIRRILQHQGISSRYVDGRTPTNVRTAVKNEFKRRRLWVIVATRVFDAGIDLPLADTLVLAGGEKAHIGLRQRLGRVLRATDKKNTATIFDFSHEAHWILIRHAIQRLEIYQSEGHKVVPVRSKRDMIKIASTLPKRRAA